MRERFWRALFGAGTAVVVLCLGAPATGSSVTPQVVLHRAGPALDQAGVGFDLAADPPPQESSSSNGASGSIPSESSPSESAPSETVPGWPFTDLDPDTSGADAVMDLYRHGIVKGVGQGRFEPQRPVTRAEFTKLVLLCLGIQPARGFREPFGDVPDQGWSAPYVTAAWRLGIVQGDSSSRFRPDAPVTNEEMAVIAWRAENKKGKRGRPSGIADAAEIHSWAVPAVADAVARGLLVPDASGRLHARDAATRLSAAVFADRLLQDRADAGGTAQVATVDGQTFPYLKSWTMQASAYSSSEPGIGDRTATGLPVRDGIVAVDPSVIPLGSYVYVEGYGFALAADTGGSIKGARIDVYIDAPAKVVQRFGVKKRKVYLIAAPH